MTGLFRQRAAWWRWTERTGNGVEDRMMAAWNSNQVWQWQIGRRAPLTAAEKKDDARDNSERRLQSRVLQVEDKIQ